MSAAITPLPPRFGTAPRPRMNTLRLHLRRFRPGRIVQAGLVALIGWGFVGSLALDLSGRAVAHLWLAGAVAIAVLAGAAAVLAGD